MELHGGAPRALTGQIGSLHQKLATAPAVVLACLLTGLTVSQLTTLQQNPQARYQCPLVLVIAVSQGCWVHESQLSTSCQRGWDQRSGDLPFVFDTQGHVSLSQGIDPTVTVSAVQHVSPHLDSS